MRHARDDYNRIQDPLGKIPDNEPVFLLRAQDVTAVDTVKHWCALNLLNAEGCDIEAVELALAHVKLMQAWPKKKVADVVPGAAEKIGFPKDKVLPHALACAAPIEYPDKVTALVKRLQEGGGTTEAEVADVADAYREQFLRANPKADIAQCKASVVNGKLLFDVFLNSPTPCPHIVVGIASAEFRVNQI